VDSTILRERIDQLNAKAQDLMARDASQAHLLSQDAYQLAVELEANGFPYPLGKAASLRILCNLDLLVDNQVAQGIQRRYGGDEFVILLPEAD
jgi:hypothetical protein